MEQLREELLASNPVEMRRRANAVLGQILAKRLDPRYRRTALDVLKRLDEQERAAASADREGGAAKRMRSTSTKPPVDLDQLINEIAQIAEQRRRSRELEPPLMPVLDACQDDPRHAAREATQLLAEVVGERQGMVSPDHESPIVEVGKKDGSPLPAICTKEVSEGTDLEVLEPATIENATETEVSMSVGSPGPAPEVKFDLVPIPGYFPPRFRRVQRRG
jgi:hypothetical protein